jgi:hypothetical protein
MTPQLTCVTGQGPAITRDLDAYLTADLRETARLDANRWIKSLRLVSYDGRSMRERFTYRGDSLWWFTELYLHKMRRLDRAVSAILALDAAVAAESPARLVVSRADVVIAETARAFGAARGVPVEVSVDGPPVTDAARQSLVFGVTTRLSRLRPARRPRRLTRATAAAFVHTAFWRAAAADDGSRRGSEGYIGPVLDAVAARAPGGALALVGVGPRRNFRARRWWDPVSSVGASQLAITPVERFAPLASIRESLGLWRERHALAHALVSGAGVRAAALFRGCDLWPVLSRDLIEAALLQWPWSTRAMDEAAAAIDALDPHVVLTYAEAGGWGRALVLEARRRGVPSVGVQHGFIYRHWLNYLHELDEMTPIGADRGFPYPDRTLLFDRYAEAHLTDAGHFPPASLAVIGNARLDILTRQAAAITDDDRAAARVITGAFPHQRLGLFAAKFSEIRHLLPAFVRAVAGSPDVHVAIKAHPAETADVYTPFIGGTSNVTLVPGDADLARLLAVSDGLITLNSTVAIDALTLGLPALVIGLPNNLSPFVSAGVMIGCDDSETGMRDGLRTLLYDQEARQQVIERSGGFLERYGMRATGRAADEAADTILALAQRTGS